MAESFAFEVAGQVLAKLTTLAIQKVGSIWGVKNDLKKLERTVSSIEAVLLDAEEKKTSQHIADWLEKLHEVLEDADNLLDDYMTEELRRVVIKGSKRKAFKKFFSRSNSLLLRNEMSNKLKKIQLDLQEIDSDKKRYAFVERVLDTPVALHRNRQTHSFVPASKVIGRNDDKDRVIKILLSTPTSLGSSTTIAENIHVLPIVGLGGLGKTTLAKLVYNDGAISSHFELKLWICVSDEFDLKKMIEKIMKDATGEDDHSQLNLNQLQARLQNTLESKKFLLVLDDVWTEDSKVWTELKELLLCGNHGSKVVVTTRKNLTSQITGTYPMYELKGLSDDECMSIFVGCAFKEGEDVQYKNLLEIGKAIVKKCNGVPLAVKSLGSLLLTKREEREWVRIRDAGIWEIAQKENDIIPILKLSYDDMEQHLKPCFAYCAVFPKDVIITRLNIVSQWMAHGLLNSGYSAQNGRLSLEDIGDCYLQEFVSRSFFQDVKRIYNGTLNTFQMHDLLHDLAQSAGKAISHIKLDSGEDISEKTRHLLISNQSLESTEFPHFLIKLEKLRTLRFEFTPLSISSKTLDTLIKSWPFSCLRVLQIPGSECKELQNSIGMLKNLRILDLSNHVKLKRLSNNLCTLINLQTLDLYGCTMLQDLPREFGNLRSLRSLSLTCQMKCFPMKGVAEGLSSLQTLWLTECLHLKSFLEGTKYLIALRTLQIHACPNLTSLPAESMKYLTRLEDLLISNCKKFSFSDEDSKTMELPRGLLSLVLVSLPKLTELSSGIQGDSLKSIDIYNCSSFAILPEWLKKCTSLSKLRLVGCAEYLKENCQPETGTYFPFVSHIPQIDFA